jgi:mannosyltransferase OCH1-like enzyme
VIPKILHRVWLDEPVPERWDRFWVRFAELHPDWQLVTWDSSAGLRSWMRCADVFDRQDTWAGRSDVVRYEVLARYGGVYVDTDVEPLKPFDDLLGPTPFIAWETNRLLCPTVLGSPAGHPAIENLLDRLPQWSYKRVGKPPNQQTGPYFVTWCWSHRTDVRRLEAQTFYPVGWWEREKLGGPYPAESYAVHHWSAGWLDGGPGSHRIKRIAT